MPLRITTKQCEYLSYRLRGGMGLGLWSFFLPLGGAVGGAMELRGRPKKFAKNPGAFVYASFIVSKTEGSVGVGGRRGIPSHLRTTGCLSNTS
jgi:hypothetical protein